MLGSYSLWETRGQESSQGPPKTQQEGWADRISEAVPETPASGPTYWATCACLRTWTKPRLHRPSRESPNPSRACCESGNPVSPALETRGAALCLEGDGGWWIRRLPPSPSGAPLLKQVERSRESGGPVHCSKGPTFTSAKMYPIERPQLHTISCQNCCCFLPSNTLDSLDQATEGALSSRFCFVPRGKSAWSSRCSCKV